MQVKIAPSILSADFAHMADAIKKCEEAGADMIHCDVMDGTFVEPITFGAQMIKSIRPLTKLPLDVHLMIEHPHTQIKDMVEAGADIITVQVEACEKVSPRYLKEVLLLIKSYGIKCGAVINPNTDIAKLLKMDKMRHIYQYCDMVLFMSVFPGYGGQQLIPEVINKIKIFKDYITAEGNDIDIEIDGGINFETARLAKEAGANILVSGATLFKADDMAAAIKEMRN